MEKTITVIPATIAKEQPHRLKVAAYYRVSTEHDEQTQSLKSQAAHFTGIISENPDWDFAGIYAERESGTGTENRDELNRMLADCEVGKINLILTKSMSRFSRNTLDTLKILSQLLKLDVEVQFEIEGIRAKDERIIQAIAGAAACAQDESRARSENIKWGIQRSVERGNVKINIPIFLDTPKMRTAN